jgi:hypothetical protein
MIIPIRLPPVEVHINADRRLAFEVLSAFGARRVVGGAEGRGRAQARRVPRPVLDAPTTEDLSRRAR